MLNLQDTIVAIATPPGRGGLGIVRLSGNLAAEIASTMTGITPESWKPARSPLKDAAGLMIDDVLVTLFARPRSYTGEDVVEISCHGAPVVLRACAEHALQLGARLAEPGEFTLRAFLNGRVDLPQAEGIRDLIEATTLHQARVAAQQTGGIMARRIRPLKEQLVELIALLEAGIDFAEDDVSVAPDAEILRRLTPVLEGITALARSYGFGHVLREGFTLALIGRPNVGKSSLFNRLLEQDRAIVTDIPGTTRDLVSEVTAIDGIPVRLVDTAGIREGEGLVEQLGIERSYSAMADADLTIVVLDSGAGLEDRDKELIDRANSAGACLIAANKADLGTNPHKDAIAVSAVTGQGIEELRRAIIENVVRDGIMDAGGAVVTSLRQINLLREAEAALVQGRTAVATGTPHEMLLLDLYTALRALDGISGKTTADDILNRIFSTFCIGK